MVLSSVGIKGSLSSQSRRKTGGLIKLMDTALHLSLINIVNVSLCELITGNGPWHRASSGRLIGKCEAKHQNTFEDLWVAESATVPYAST